jgi:hypothetical protein
MAAAPIPEPDRSSSARPSAVAGGPGGTGSIYELLYKLLSQCPAWVRVVAVLVLASAIGIAVAKRLLPPEPTPQTAQRQATIAVQLATVPYSIVDGTQVNAPGNANQLAENEDATHHVAEVAEHAQWHAEHPEIPEPPLNVITQTDEKNFVKFKFYSKTDGCVFVLRQVNGVPTSQWVRNPHFKEVAAVLRDADSDRKSQEGSDTRAIAGLLDALVLPAAAATPRPSAAAASVQLQNVQAQAGCVNPPSRTIQLVVGNPRRSMLDSHVQAVEGWMQTLPAV